MDGKLAKKLGEAVAALIVFAFWAPVLTAVTRETAASCAVAGAAVWWLAFGAVWMLPDYPLAYLTVLGVCIGAFREAQRYEVAEQAIVKLAGEN